MDNPSQIQYNILIMDNVKINHISPFNEWLAQRKLNENKTENIELWDNHVYGFAEYSEPLQEAYCTLQFDHYNSVIDNDHVLRAARNLFLYHIISDIKKRFNYDDTK